MAKSPPKKIAARKIAPSAGRPADPRSEVLRLLDKIVLEAIRDLADEDADRDLVASAARAAARLVEQGWTDHRLPEWKVRIWWSTTDVTVRAGNERDASATAVSISQKPLPVKITVFREDPAGSWREEISFDF